VFLALCLGAGVAILWLNQGRFLYTMDDAYIHLALAENLAQGHYGVNPGELSAPASSILWPLLLVPAAWTGVEEAIPLLLNIAASGVTLALYWTVVEQALAEIPAERRMRATALIVTLLIPATNLVGLAFMGMEHSLQLLLATAVVAGLVVERETHRVSWWLALAVVAGPLVRYEALALSLLPSSTWPGGATGGWPRFAG
jgi:hypothetical protein